VNNAFTALDWYRRALAAGFAATLALTPRLWMSVREFPHTPLIPGMPQPPPPLDVVLFALMLAALAGVALLRNPRPAIWTVSAIGLLWGILDQARWHAWFFEIVLLIGLLALVPWSRRENATTSELAWSLTPSRLVLVFTYLFAGLQKLNFDFATWLFLWFVEPLLGRVGIVAGDLDPTLVTVVAIAAALVEASCGVLLLVPRARRLALYGLTAVHALILLVVGPLGHNDNAAIVPWNIVMVVALWTLFGVTAPPADTPVILSPAWWRALVASAPRAARIATLAIVAAFGVMPIVGLLGAWDAYLSFALYSGNTYDGLFHVDARDSTLLPPSAQRAINPDGTLDPFKWSSEATGASMYPELRILESAGRALARSARNRDVYLRYTEPPNRFTGERVARNLRFVRGGERVEEVDLPAQE
jgi:hypothetical protein